MYSQTPTAGITVINGLMIATAIPSTGQHAYRIEIRNAYCTAVKPSFDDKILAQEATFKWAPFEKDGTANRVERSTNGNVVLPAVPSYN